MHKFVDIIQEVWESSTSGSDWHSKWLFKKHDNAEWETLTKDVEWTFLMQPQVSMKRAPVIVRREFEYEWKYPGGYPKQGTVCYVADPTHPQYASKVKFDKDSPIHRIAFSRQILAPTEEEAAIIAKRMVGRRDNAIV